MQDTQLLNRVSRTSVPMSYQDEVRDALAAGRAVVALESNVITHGISYPENAATVVRMESAVRAAGAVPATLWIDRGRIMVGATSGDIERLAVNTNLPKASSRDLAVLLASGATAVTTVAGSLVAAELAGISFFSSAGIGGVHRGAERTMDISPDLIQLTRSKVAVVCAGAKSILDLPRTMEFLETHCVPVIAYRSDDFPAFYCASSGFPAPHRVDDERVIARAIGHHWDLGHRSAVLVTTPIRREDAIPFEEIDPVIEQAISAAERDGVKGAAITKCIMRAVDAATGGRTSRANIAVLISTAEVAGRLAAAYAAEIRRKEEK